MRKGADRDTAEDLAQEAAAAVVSQGVEFADAADLWPFVWVVAERRLIDRRRSGWRLVLGDVPDRADSSTPGDMSEARVVAAELRRELDAMPELDRIAIGRFIAGQPDPPGRGAYWRVRRHRARLRLEQALARISGPIAGIACRWRSLVEAAMPVAVAGAALAVPVLCPPGTGQAGPRTVWLSMAADGAVEAASVTEAVPGPVESRPSDAARVGTRNRAPHDGEGTAPEPVVAVTLAGQNAATADHWRGDWTDPLVCAENLRLVGSVCVERPAPTPRLP